MVNEQKVLQYFKKQDPRLAAIYLQVWPLEPIIPRKPEQFFISLCREIIGQQLSGKVAEVIFSRFISLFPKHNITPRSLLKIPEQELRDAGMAWSKVRYIRDLAFKVKTKELKMTTLMNLSDEALKKEILKVKGIGPWTAEMFLIFTLDRPDVFSVGDLGLRRAIQKIYHLKKEPSAEQLIKISAKWAPYRTWASRILWKSLEIK